MTFPRDRPQRFVTPEEANGALKRVEIRFKEHAHVIGEHRTHINRLNQHVFGTMAPDPYEQANKYNAIVLGIGYAGFFALWNQVGGVDSPRLHAVAGIAIAVSLFLFVFWEVLTMYNRTEYLVGSKPRLTDDQIKRTGRWVFYASVLTGAAAGICEFAVLGQKIGTAFG